MMLKFRAWDKLGKEMHKVSAIDFSSKGARIIRLAGVQSNGKENHKRWHSSVELMQYTGLKDKNNNEIYAGDIVEFDISVAYEYDILNKAIVTMSNVGGVKPTLFTMEECGDIVEWSYFEKDIDELDFFDDCKVVGNIYETPHLL
ncbi:hypothetical protein GZ142_09225 [Staphylococcus aureus]|nr:YopX family protein [Staphylococcus aureus]NDP52995.1 hypothetical protein [Staphylococcus aureus]NDQ33200.1 hypothetical protein [Staphylococcus aureus]NDQ43406.1 hypothetical protein [Staphylococcus aureus]NDR31776.1 hypothetical protein [Staphylococcus aureus]HDA3753913.1 hypothetical protein [Staphylococcus aureus]